MCEMVDDEDGLQVYYFKETVKKKEKMSRKKLKTKNNEFCVCVCV